MADNVNRDRGTNRRERTRRERVEGGRNQERDLLEILYLSAQTNRDVIAKTRSLRMSISLSAKALGRLEE